MTAILRRPWIAPGSRAMAVSSAAALSVLCIAVAAMIQRPLIHDTGAAGKGEEEGVQPRPEDR
jgi:hypothetical protein